MAIYIGVTNRTLEIRLKEDQNAFTSRNLNSKIITHAIQTYHFPVFEMSLNQIAKYMGDVFSWRHGLEDSEISNE